MPSFNILHYRKKLPDEMSEQSLKEKTAKGLFWGGISNTVQQLLNLFFGIFLARILTAEDYGMVGMLAIFPAVAGSLQESGFTAALTNKRDADDKDYNAVFWFSTLMGAGMYLLLFITAPLIAAFYEIPELTPLARFLFLGFFISSTGIAHNAILFKNLMVKEKAKIDISALVISGTVGVVMAVNGMAYWGIAAQSVIYITVGTLLRWHFSPWRPSFHIDFTPLKGMFAFSSKLLLTNLLNQINANLFSVLLGKFFTRSETGYYTQSNKWMMMGHLIIASSVNTVAQPTFAQLSNDKERQARVFLKLLHFIAFISFPAMLGLAFVSREFITITIGTKWLPSVPILQLLCIVGAVWPITNLYSQFAISKGASGIFLWVNLAFGIMQFTVALCMISFGIWWLVFANVMGYLVLLAIWQCIIKRQIGISHIQAAKAIMTYVIPTLLSFTVAHYATCTISNLYLLMTGKILVTAACYVAVMKLCRSEILAECIAFATRQLKKK